MDNSIYGYLSRQSNEELEKLLALYGEETDNELDAEVKQLVEQVLTERANQTEDKL